MNLRDNKTYIDELFDRVQNGYLNPDEASTLLWAILDSFNRAYLASQDNYPREPREPRGIQRRTPLSTLASGTTETEEQVIWSASGTMTAPDGTETPISKVTLRIPTKAGTPRFMPGHSTPPVIGAKLRMNTDAFRPTCTACGEPVTWVGSQSKWIHESGPAVPHQVGYPSAQFTDDLVRVPVNVNNGPLADHKIITRIHRDPSMPISEYLAAVRNTMRALDQDGIKFVKAENDERTTMYFYNELELKSQVGDCQRHPTSSAPGPLYCYKCKGALTFVEVSAGIGHWAHLNPAQQESHKPDLIGPSTGEHERTCIKCRQPIFYGAHPNGGIGWVHYGSVDPDHVAVEEIRTPPLSSNPMDWPVKIPVSDRPLTDELRRSQNTFEFDALAGRLSTDDPGLSDVIPNACTTCGQPMQYVNAPTGGWWAHDVHPADGHDATSPDAGGDDIPEDWDTEDELMGHNTSMDRPKISMPPIEVPSASMGRLVQRLKSLHPTGNNEEFVDVLAGEDPEEYDLIDLDKLDTPAEPQINISAGSVSPGAYTLWNSLTSDSAAAIHKTHRDGQAEQA